MENPYSNVGKEAMLLRQENISRLMADADVQIFLRKNNLPVSVLENNSYLFKRWTENKKLCTQCKGLDLCMQTPKGMVESLAVDVYGDLETEFVPCDKSVKEARETGYLKNYLIDHSNEECLKINVKTIKYNGMPQSYSQALKAVTQSNRTDKGLYLYGQPGTGKSYMLSVLLNTYAQAGKKVAFVKVPLLMQQLKENFKDETFQQQTLRALRSADVLVLDDIGSEALSRWNRDEVLFPILDYRMNKKGSKTYFTSNYTPSQLEMQYTLQKQSNDGVAAARLLERIWKLARPLEVVGNSLR